MFMADLMDHNTSRKKSVSYTVKPASNNLIFKNLLG